MPPLESLVAAVKDVCARLPDRRNGRNRQYEIGDIGMGAFSVFFMQCPSFLAHQRQLLKGQGRSNCQTLFEMAKIPTDNHIRTMLDPVDPASFHPLFERALHDLEAGGGLADFQRLGHHVLIALDGTQFHRSSKVFCERCSRTTRGGKTEYSHSMVCAALVAPGHNRVVPLAPAFVEPQDGALKQDCESRACRRWLDTHAAGLAHLDPIYLGDDLYACQPICEAVRATGGHFLFVCKPDSHPTLIEYLSGIDLRHTPGCGEHVTSVKRGKKRYRHVYRWMCDLPLRDGKDALAVNWLSIDIIDPNGKTIYRNSFVTDLDVNRDNVVELAACGRARWKVENETFNTLKTKGYNLEHNFGHGKQNLAAVLAILNLLAFACHSVADVLDLGWAKARLASATRANFFNNLRSLTTYAVFSAWRDLLATLAFDTPPLTRPP